MSNSCGLAQERLELVLAMGTATPTKDKPPSSRNSSRTDRSSQPSTRRYRNVWELRGVGQLLIGAIAYAMCSVA